MLQYLYAIADRLPAAWRPPAASVGDAVELRRLGDLVLLASPLDRPPDATARAMAAHHDVVASTLDAAATLPFRFGVVVGSVDLDAWLGAHLPLVRATLTQLRGYVEMTVKLLRLHCGHSIERTCRECADGAPGVVQLRELAERLVAQAGIDRWRYRSPGGGSNVAGSVAFLVPRSEVDDFLARIAPIASRAIGIAVVPTGPWPAYSFVPTFDRFPLARADSVRRAPRPARWSVSRP
jgi:Gas vesicle synthesis protein GvpL/GvpF